MLPGPAIDVWIAAICVLTDAQYAPGAFKKGETASISSEKGNATCMQQQQQQQQQIDTEQLELDVNRYHAKGFPDKTL